MKGAYIESVNIIIYRKSCLRVTALLNVISYFAYPQFCSGFAPNVYSMNAAAVSAVSVVVMLFVRDDSMH